MVNPAEEHSNAFQACEALTEPDDVAESSKLELKTTAVSALCRESSFSDNKEPMVAVGGSNGGDNEDDNSVTLNVVYRKRKYQVDTPLDSTVANLKEKLHAIIDVPPAMQKLMIRGLATDSSTLRQLGVAAGAKVMVVGSTISDVLSIARPQEKEPLPATPLSGMLNRTGNKVRLTFKLETDHLWISTREHTEKLAMSSIKNVVSEPITGHERYHVMGIQLGPSEASRYWIYWVPSQYVNAIKNAVLGKWQYF